MPRIIKNSLLKYIPNHFSVEKIVNPYRIYNFNDIEIKSGQFVYLIEREIRFYDNFALQYALELSKRYNSDLKIIYPKIYFASEAKENFIQKQVDYTRSIFLQNNLEFIIFEGGKSELLEYLNQIGTKVLFIDFNPILDRSYLDSVSFKVVEVDSHNIIPARFLSDKQEYSAATIRRKIYYNIYPFLTDFANSKLGSCEAERTLEEFIKTKLNLFSKFKNNPEKNVQSGLSKYLNSGFISPQKTALEIIKSDVPDEDKEVFLEELVVRGSLSDNFCLYCKDYKTLNCIPEWAKKSLDFHKKDLRAYIYSLELLEKALTHDRLWNACQIQLIKDGSIHGYLRMYWAKKILEWSNSAEEALDATIYLNDTYSFDAPSTNGYVGILWAIGGLHDRAFREYPVTGKIRRMTYNSMKHKFDVDAYIRRYSK